MKWTGADIAKLVITALLITTAIIIASLTVGLDIYNGTRDKGILSFAIVNLAGYLFFLFMPVELAFIYYVSGETNIFLLNIVAIATAIVSECVDYIIGYLFSEKIINNMIGRHRFERAEEEIRKYGNIAIFVFNALPLSSPVISLAAGMLKHRKRDALINTAEGLAFKYIALSCIFG